MSIITSGLRRARRPALWVLSAPVILLIGAAVGLVFAAAGPPPAGPTELPLPVPAPVGP